jgi:hypothetical protein
VKFRWLAAQTVYAAACVGALFAPWPDSVGSGEGVRTDWALLRGFVETGDFVAALRLGWMIPVLAASVAVWFSARRGIRPAHTEISVALALGAVAYPFASYSEPGCPSIWVESSAAAFILVFAAVLGRRAFVRQREELRHDSPAVVRHL